MYFYIMKDVNFINIGINLGYFLYSNPSVQCLTIKLWIVTDNYNVGYLDIILLII